MKPARKFVRSPATNTAWVIDIYEKGWRWARACRNLADARFWVKQYGEDARTRIRRFEVAK